ncbi:MAG TPA: RNA polymerase sigma factor [Gaiellales bacterium]|nr:RNA polymerase sigma factor [Gaiellales bacterium]
MPMFAVMNADARPAVDAAFRDHWARAVGALWRRFGDPDLAEEAVQEAFTRAAARWAVEGVPDEPAAWLIATAGNVAVDRLRRDRTLAAKLPQLDLPGVEPPPEIVDDRLPDDRLELIFACCHPALPTEAQVALTLRLAGGLSTPEIAHAFLVSEPVMAQRLVRAKRRLRVAGIGLRESPEPVVPDRLDQVMAVLYLIFNEGYAASSGDAPVRQELCAEAIRLARILASLLLGEPEPSGLVALMLFHHARAPARTGADGAPVLLDDQDRSRWDRALIEEGEEALGDAAGAGWLGVYCLQAAIAREHVRAASPADTDWRAIVRLYDDLAAVAPSPVVELNRAVAISMSEGPEWGLAIVDGLASDPALAGYHLLPAARADMLRRLGRNAEALEAYRRALELAPGAADRAFLSRRCAELAH